VYPKDVFVMTELRTVFKALWHTLVFWGGSLLVALQVERLFLLPKVTAVEPPTADILVRTFLLGSCNDLITMVGAYVLALFLAGIATGALALGRPMRSVRECCDAYGKNLTTIAVLIFIAVVGIVSVDIGYYSFSHQHLNFIFFEYVGDIVSGMSEGTTSQASEQTDAELEEIWTYLFRTFAYLGLVALGIAVWKVTYRRMMERVGVGPSYSVGITVGLLFVFGTTTGVAAGYGGRPLPFIDALHVQSDAYEMLSQSPILFAVKPAADVFLPQRTWSPSTLPHGMTVTEAIGHTQAVLGQGEEFPYSEYPLIRRNVDSEPPYFGRRTNVLILFVEGLDRRFIDRIQSVGRIPDSGEASALPRVSIRITPFLDRLKNDSLYFSHFFSNGVQTTRGLFSTLCSTFPRQGAAAIKTRYAHDYQCLPSVLQKAGYRTEMVVSSRTNLSGLGEFFGKNGIEKYYHDDEFPSDAERLGIGLTDGALFDFMETRLDALQSSDRPFLLTALTAGTHHPFVVPTDHAEVKALQRDPDHYMAALRYFDLAFERFFNRIQSKGLLKNTLVVILGDHGRHETIGKTDAERQAGHFLAPMFLWVDDSLRTEGPYRPRVVSHVASQVDVAPTVLAIAGLTPQLTSSVGRSVACLLKSDCLSENQAYLSSVYDDLVGLADQSGIWLYSFRRNQMMVVDLDQQASSTVPAPQHPTTKEHARTVAALYLASNTLLERNRIWSWQVLASK
jgi:hypothetical protein